MRIHKDMRGDVVRLKIAGDINYDVTEDFTKALMENIAKKKPLIEIDLSGCNFMSSNAIGALAAALMVARSRGGDLKLAGASKNVLELLELTTLKSIINIADDYVDSE
jgi:anti-sigma B factor antagonist